MFSNYEHFLQATRNLFDAQVAFATNVVHAVLDAGVNAAELNVEAIKSLLATATVATRQWLVAGAVDDWLTPVPQRHNDGQLVLAALPDSARAAIAP